MATRTISLEIEAHERLRAARRTPNESLSQVVMRARWPERTITAAELVESYRTHGPCLDEDGIAIVEELKRTAEPPQDRWPMDPES